MKWLVIENIFRNEPLFRLKQAKRAVFIDLVKDWKEVSVFPKTLKEKLIKKCSLEIKSEIFSQGTATRKAILTFEDGVKIETVLMEKLSGKIAVCVSCQAGCAMGCAFCATGNIGFQRNLTADEIIQQALFWQRILKKEGKKRITNIVFMGMGEPLLNYQAVKEAILFFNDPETFNLGQRKISVSTVGIKEGIKKFSQEKWQVNLAFSLHFADKSKRSFYMPIEKKQSAEDILAEIRQYIKENRRKVMIEYVLFDGINDSLKEAEKLAKILKDKLGGLFMVNLIAGNLVKNFYPSSNRRINQFQEKLKEKGIEVIRRFSFGGKIKGACGQLSGKV